MKIIVDAMGGDYAPLAPVQGAIDAAKAYGVEIVLVGQEDRIREVMKENNFIRTGSSPDMYENDTGLYHKTLEFAKERMEI